MARASRRVSARPMWGRPHASDERGCGASADALTRSVMCASWRSDSLCVVIPETFGAASWQAQCGLCATCPVVEVCFWSALIEERGFRTVAGNPPGVRGGVEGGRRRFILGELTDPELEARYTAAVTDYGVSAPTTSTQTSLAMSANASALVHDPAVSTAAAKGNTPAPATNQLLSPASNGQLEVSSLPDVSADVQCDSTERVTSSDLGAKRAVVLVEVPPLPYFTLVTDDNRRQHDELQAHVDIGNDEADLRLAARSNAGTSNVTVSVEPVWFAA